MSRPFKDPSLLTKDRLKKELESNGIKLPRGDQKKEFYIKLYQENLSPQHSGRRLENGEFSSDDDCEVSEHRKVIIPRTSRSIKKVGSKEIISNEIKSLTNEELREELGDLGENVGPILPSTRNIYELKLARLQAMSPKNSGTIATITNSEFSDDCEEQEAEEENVPNDEFSYGTGSQSRRSDDFGSTFSKNFEGSSSKKEVMRDFSMSSSRNVEHSSTFDRQTINKVRTKKGDKFEEKSWSSAGDDEKEKEDGGINMNSLPSSIQMALTTAGRLTPEKENGTGVRERSSWKSKPEQVSEKRSQRNVEEKPTTEDKKKEKGGTSSRKWWILLIVLILLVILATAVVFNVERLPILEQQFPFLVSPKNDTH